ncbi:hypothetical protein SAMN05428938_1167 [Streptomyces sp. KS_5]|nr:hypothetical protein SAMN05428938_1167 [Streptomyces sp. KS_5]
MVAADRHGVGSIRHSATVPASRAPVLTTVAGSAPCPSHSSGAVSSGASGG